ncbi:MAG: aldose epimerase [Verrucomicrobia bacterium]|nr:aldose epimerase [Verrucomicrobiota bacterium]
MEKVPYLGKSLTRWRVGQSTFLVMPEMGARLMNWNITLADGSVRDVIYWPELTTLDNFHLVRGGNPVLFPFNGRCFDRGEIFFWRSPDGVKRAIPIHGIARQGEFKITSIDARGFSAQFLPGDEARAAYPFDYDFVITYRFEATALSCEYALTNRGTVPLPWCAGHHFYFTLPWSEGTKRSDYSIRIPATKRMKQDKTGTLVSGPDLQPEENVGNPALIDTFHSALRNNEVVFGEKGRPGAVTVKLGTAGVPAPENCFVTWTLADDSPFYCVEPWMGPANSPEHKIGLHQVAPGMTQKFSVSVSVR